MAKRRVGIDEERAALSAWQAGARDRGTTATAVRYLLEELAERAPGNSVEVRVPPFGVTQCVQGPRHTRGTPSNVIEMSAETWLALASGEIGWKAALEAGRVSASGSRASLDGLLPLTTTVTR